MNKLVVYSASAGSGKTFNLAVEYVCMLIDYLQKGKTLGFKSMLAVTFTNASTKEMKDRIIEVLISLSNEKENENSQYLESIKQKTSLSNQEISNYSNKALHEIIHNYTFFNIYTIDAFFQLILKNMAKELGMPSDFSIILDEEDYNTKAVRNIITKTINDKELSNWLYHFFIKKQDNNESWNFEKDLNDALKSINKIEQIKSLENEIYSFDNLLKRAKTLKKEINNIKIQVLQYQTKFYEVLKKYDIKIADFKAGNKSIYPKIAEKIAELKDPYLLSKRVENFYSEDDDYLKKGKTTPKDLADLIAEIDNFLQENVIKYRSLRIFYNSIYTMGVVKILYEEKLSLQKQDGVFFLSHTKDVLSQLNLMDANASDTISFIYEKVGAYLERIMIDEFQDTSVSSWQIFEPLVRECLSSPNGRTFIFGDIKQSIYRWNGGDWRLLNSLTEEENNITINLTKNYRTYGNIVDFNNNLFSYIYAERYQNQEVRDDYKDKGSVVIKFIDKEDMLQKTIDEVDYYLSLGYKTGDIAILCRKSEVLSELAQRMKELDSTNQSKYKYNPVSDGAFLLSSSDAVNLIISALKFLSSKEEIIAKEHLLSYQPSIIEDINTIRNSNYKLISLFDIVLTLSKKLQLEDTIFLPAFYDAVKNFATERQGGVKEFLDYWKTTLKDNKVELSFGDNSLRLTTIHKSKGLEYNIVILPYFNWTLSKTSDFIWVNNTENKIIDIPVVRSRISDLKNTDFDEVYQEEISMQVAESYNLLYVACTRAKKHLSIIATHSQKHKKGEEKNVGDLLYNYIEQNAESFSSTQEEYIYKNIDPVFYDNNNQIASSLENTSKQETEAIWFSHNAVVFSSPSLSETYFRDASFDETESKRLFGTNMHNIISMLESRDDIEKYSVFFAKRYEDWEDISKILFAMFDYSKDRFWFEGKYKILNEKSIILQNQDSKTITKRPDRIMIGQDRVDIVDYKFTKKDEILHQKYIIQVTEYKQLLEQMDYKNVSAYLWYIDTENRVLKSQEIISIN